MLKLVLYCCFLAALISSSCSKRQTAALREAFANQAPLDCGPSRSDFGSLNQDISNYIDNVLSNLRKTLEEKGFSQVKLPDASTSHSTPFLGVNWMAEAAVDNGTLVGVETMYRRGASAVNFTDDFIQFSSDVGFKMLNMSYNLRAQFMGIGPEARVMGSMDSVKCFLSGRATRDPPIIVTLEELKLKDIGRVTLDVEGVGHLWDQISNSVRENLGRVFTMFIRDLVENSIKDMLNGIMSSTVLPKDPGCYLI